MWRILTLHVSSYFLNVFLGFEQIEIFDNYKDLVKGLYNMSVDTVPKLMAEKKITSVTDTMTMYSLFK